MSQNVEAAAELTLQGSFPKVALNCWDRCNPEIQSRIVVVLALDDYVADLKKDPILVWQDRYIHLLAVLVVFGCRPALAFMGRRESGPWRFLDSRRVTRCGATTRDL